MARDPAYAELAVGAPPVSQQSQMRQSGYPKRTAGVDLGWQMFVDDQEFVPKLVWPQSIQTLKVMRTDAQLAALFRAVTLPLRRMKVLIDPNGSGDEVVSNISQDFNLDILGEPPRPRGRMRGRFSHAEHFRHTFISGVYGHMFFEHVGRIENGLWRLRKLAPIMPDTITRINVADDGGLISIVQKFTRYGSAPFASWGGVEIPVDHLVGYIQDKEGANWTGRSWFRDCYRNWLIKDRLLRVDAINHERAGGVPIAKAAPGATPQEIEKLGEMAQQFKVGEGSGGAIPNLADFVLHRVGSGSDTVTSIRYHDESMARLFLHMVIELGMTETGSRALGETFSEFAWIAQASQMSWYLDTTNEHVIEDWVDWNYGPEVEQVPLLTYLIEEEDEYLPVQDMMAMIEIGVLQVDEELEDYLRHRFKLPPRTKVTDPRIVTAKTGGREFIKEMRRRYLLSRYLGLRDNGHAEPSQMSRRDFFSGIRRAFS